MDPWFGILWYVYHIAVVAYFLCLMSAETRQQEERRAARLRRLEVLGFQPRTPPEPPEEIDFLA
jgi:hypothetical protein